MKKILILLASLSLIASCTPQPKAIAYGADMCDFCKMNIVDAQHAAELVTSKAKVYKFDAIECMINFSKENKATEYAFELVNIYDTPKELLNAKESYYLISKKLPSPMGANLTAFKNQKTAKEMQESKGGKIYNWEKLLKHFNTEKISMD